MTTDAPMSGAAANAVPVRRGRRGRIALAVIAILFVVEIALSLAWPHVVPRVALLPRPPEKSWYDGCNWHHRSFERAGPIWSSREFWTTRACIDNLD
jgi:hypothetical protein